MARVIFENKLKEFLDAVSESMPVFAPIQEAQETASGKINFSKYKKGDKVDFGYPVTVLPPMELLLPPKDILFSFSGNGAQKPSIPKGVIFGVSLEDLEGLSRLRKIFSEPVADIPYLERANSFFIIAIDHFSPPRELEYDLYLQRMTGGRYAAYAKTVQGRKWLRGTYFKNQNIKVPKVTKKKDPLIWGPEIAGIVENSKNNPIWDELAEICFGCGICSFVCPLCYCYETEDEIEFPIKTDLCGKRCRNWDSCMLSHFADTSSHNFRPELRDRIYNWYFHKFVRMPSEYGFPGCVECNRCIVYCPARINYREVLEKLRKDDKKKPRNVGKGKM